MDSMYILAEHPTENAIVNDSQRDVAKLYAFISFIWTPALHAIRTFRTVDISSFAHGEFKYSSGAACPTLSRDPWEWQPCPMSVMTVITMVVTSTM